MSRGNGTAGAQLRPGVAFRFSFRLFPLFLRLLGLPSSLSGGDTSPFTWQPCPHTRARPHNPARRMLPTPKNRNQTMVWRIRTCPHSLPRRSARNAIPAAVLRQAAALKDPPGAAITWAGVGGFDGWAANQTKDAATPAPPINAPTIKFQIILSLCHASFSPMSDLVF